MKLQASLLSLILIFIPLSVKANEITTQAVQECQNAYNTNILADIISVCEKGITTINHLLLPRPEFKQSPDTWDKEMWNEYLDFLDIAIHEDMARDKYSKGDDAKDADMKLYIIKYVLVNIPHFTTDENILNRSVALSDLLYKFSLI